ncbi:MAG: hypothetical protein J6Q48_05865 [Bacteroidaceae bacterium]|nr:hypothetical protein [Bacteroidaceae bacterium]
MARKNSEFYESAKRNKASYLVYFDRLTELAISMFEWVNLPSSIDPRFLELTLVGDGMAVFFSDEILGYLALQTTIGGRLSVYRIPIDRRAFSSNGYQRQLDDTNSVIIFNNLLHTNGALELEKFARQLYELDRIVDINARAQKTPILITCDESERLTMQNLYMKYDGNQPLILGDKSLNPKSLQVLNTGAPYVADKIYTLKKQIWNEALTYLGISNVNIEKRERLISDEVLRNSGGVVASRYSRLEARRQACREINAMFGLNIWVNYREDFQIVSEEPAIPTNEDAEDGGEADE